METIAIPAISMRCQQAAWKWIVQSELCETAAISPAREISNKPNNRRKDTT
ncbi:hypothetical protein [Undibacterium sp. YM2]|uniref:hypothetical protein n=1 Tax=Undibacterium sp. YM2 TaxID=2058625 RepID=UPI001389D61C|nr:hypothetical protein [Undibacterium sp. YM2]